MKKISSVTKSIFYSFAVIATMFLSATVASAAKLTFSGSTRSAIEVTPAASTGLEAVYVIETLNASTEVIFEATDSGAASSVKWQRFSNLGGGFAENVTARTEGKCSIINAITPAQATNCNGIGLIVEYDERQHCFWVVNYQANECKLGELTFAPEQECNRTAILFDGYAPKITYYTINGATQTLSRDMQLTYNTLVYNIETQQYDQQQVTESLDYADGTIRVDAPLCDTEFTLTADRFQRQWTAEQANEAWLAEVTSATYTTIAIDATTHITQEVRDNGNEQTDGTGAIGGSGPVDVTFTAEVTDAVVFKEWQFARDQQFDLIDLRIQDLEVQHTFSDYGTTYVRFVADNNAGTCQYVSETYEVYVGESKLLCPNAFSPGASEGVNDEWMVSYKSIIDFDCHIFNRWGVEMAHLTHPSQGWDGYYKGKLVPSGVYYYVIKATGSDGKKYKLSGDINILKSNSISTGTSGSTDTLQ